MILSPSSLLPPVVERELRVTARRPGTYWGRTAAGLLAVVVLSIVLLAQLTTVPLNVVGQIIFRLLGGLTAITVLTSVMQFSSEAFAREKREDTLGLLFLTPLRPVDIVLGKLVSTSLSAFYRFLAVVPVLAVPMLAGGVTIGDFSLLVVALFNLTFLGATVGLWVSALCWDEKRAASWASSLIIVVLAFPAIVAAGIASNSGTSIAMPWAAVSPGFAVWQAVAPSPGNTFALSASLAWTQLLGWLFFTAACRTLPRCWQKRPESLAPRGDHLSAPSPEPASTAVGSTTTPEKPESKRTRRLVRRDFSFEQRSQLLAHNPLAWFAMRWKPHASGTWAVAVIAVIGYVPTVLAGLITNDWELLLAPGWALVVMFFVHTAIKTFASHQASYTFARDRGEDTLELLLSTPVAARQLIDGHEQALRSILDPVLRRALWIESIGLAILIAGHIGRRGEDTLFYVLGGAAMLGLLVSDVRALTWTAMWQSVIKKNAREAQQEATSKLVILPWLIAGIASFIGLLAASGDGGLLTLILSWTLASFFLNTHFSVHSREQLAAHLTLWAARRAAAEYEHYDGWKNLGRRLGRWWARRGQTSAI